MKKYVLLALLCSYSALFSQGLAFSRILIVPYDVQGALYNYNSGDVFAIRVPQGKVWKITVPESNNDAFVYTTLNPNGWPTSSLGANSIQSWSFDYFISKFVNGGNKLSPEATVWLGENHGLLFECLNTSCIPDEFINIIEYDVLP